jgi:hypothetical protein
VNFNSNRNWETRVPVQVTGADIEGLRVVVSAGADVTGHIKVEDDEPHTFQRQMVFFENGDQTAGSYINESAGFAVKLSPGHYVVGIPALINSALYKKHKFRRGRSGCLP